MLGPVRPSAIGKKFSFFQQFLTGFLSNFCLKFDRFLTNFSPYLLDFSINKKDLEQVHKYQRKHNKAKGGKNLLHTSRKSKISNAYSFDKYSKRPDLFGASTKQNKFAPIYYPDYNYCKKRITTHVIPFNKTTGRFYKSRSPASYKTPVFVAMSNAKMARSIATSGKKNHVNFDK